MKTVSNEILSDITVYSKYAKYVPELSRRETWEELVYRNMDMHIAKYPKLRTQILSVYTNYVLPKKVLPSMRSLQFGGQPIDLAPNRIFNCAFMPVDSLECFSEMMFLLLGGTGGGFSVQTRHVSQLPEVLSPKTGERRYVIGDSIEGWADAIKVLIEAHFLGKERVRFDYRDIREKGAELITSGGKAPGPEPLRTCLQHLEQLLYGAAGRNITNLEAHDMMCFIADAVLAGGIRRAALISLFSRDDMEMLNCKAGPWWELNPQRGRANNSCTLPRGQVTEEEFKRIWARVEASGSGEPGVYWTNNEDWGTNPCCEIALQPYQFCNLTELNVGDVTSQEDLNGRARAASFIGTLQAGYTDFHYLRPIWKRTTEEDALVGVGMTGIGSGAILPFNLQEAAHESNRENSRVAGLIGINEASRVTTIKPAGTSSLVLGSASGIHAWHNDYYVRRMRIGKNEALYKYMARTNPALVEDEFFRPEEMACITIPQNAPSGAILRTETPLDLLERVKRFNVEWVHEGHRKGDNKNNVSCTISLKEDEWIDCGQWMWDNRGIYNGISVLPYDGGTYTQAPFEDITEAEFKELEQHLHSVDLTQVLEESDNTDLSGEAACAGGVCEIKAL
jgi:ribonucleoside-triphosphate reductase (thioredoxin)